MSGKVIGSGGVGYITNGFPAPGLRNCQRLITAFNGEGKGVFVTKDHGDHHRVMGDKQAVANIIYSTYENPVNINEDKDMKLAAAEEPGLHNTNGTLVRLIDFAPGLESPIHRAMSIDYGIVIEGEFELILDSGEIQLMKQGDISVQRATAHKWKNVTAGCTKPGRMVFILLDVTDVIVNGQKVEGFLGELESEYAGRGA